MLGLTLLAAVAVAFSCPVSSGGIGVVVTAVALVLVSFVVVVVIFAADTSARSPAASPSSPATVTIPYIPGWNAQKYSDVLGSSNVTVKSFRIGYGSGGTSPSSSPPSSVTAV